jgi:hypothetical protein
MANTFRELRWKEEKRIPVFLWSESKPIVLPQATIPLGINQTDSLAANKDHKTLQ